MFQRIKNNLSTKILAFGMALLLWVFVNTQTNSQLEEIYSNIPVEAINLADNLALVNKLNAIQVRVTGSRPALAMLTSRDIKATVDLSAVTAGNNMVSVDIAVPKGIEIVSITPAKINVAVDRIVEEKWPVTVKVIGQLDETKKHGEPTIKPDFVFLVGASELLKQVREVFVTIQLSEDISDDLRVNLPLEVVDHSNISITNMLRINPQWVETLVPIQSTVISKELPVGVQLTGEVSESYILNTAIKPTKITITGPEQVLSELEEISAGEIDVENLTEAVVVERELNIPPNTQVTEKTVEVTIVVEPRGEERQE